MKPHDLLAISSLRSCMEFTMICGHSFSNEGPALSGTKTHSVLLQMTCQLRSGMRMVFVWTYILAVLSVAQGLSGRFCLCCCPDSFFLSSGSDHSCRQHTSHLPTCLEDCPRDDAHDALASTPIDEGPPRFTYGMPDAYRNSQS